MFKRIRWMSMGAAVGLGGSVWAQRRVRRAVERYMPDQVASQLTDRVRDLRDDVLEALDEGRVAMRAREEELRRNLGPRMGPGLAGPPSVDPALPPPGSRPIAPGSGATRHRRATPAEGRSRTRLGPAQVIEVQEGRTRDGRTAPPAPPTAPGRQPRRRRASG